MKHRYLEEINCPRIYQANMSTDEVDNRDPKWAMQRNMYGFDERETWNLGTCFYAWLYEHLKMYLDKASKIVNLDYYTFEYNGKTYTQREMIEQICEIIEYYFSDKFDDWDDDDCKYVSNIEKMWAVIMPYMWW